MKEVICINDSYNAETLEFWAEHKVSHPNKGSFYTFREVIVHTDGSTGVRLSEIENPDVPIEHPILGIIYMEPSFNINRFVTLSKEKIEEDEIKHLIKESTTIKNPGLF